MNQESARHEWLEQRSILVLVKQNQMDSKVILHGIYRPLYCRNRRGSVSPMLHSSPPFDGIVVPLEPGRAAVGDDSVRLPTGASIRDGHDNLSTSLTHPAPDTPGYNVTSSTE